MKYDHVTCVCVIIGALLTAGCQKESSTTALGLTSLSNEQVESSWGAIRGMWGPEDQRGAMNRITPETVARAAGLIQSGKIYSLGRVYEHGMPLFGQRHYSLTIPGAPTGGPMGTHNIVWHDELVSGEIGQIGTQLDGLAHIGIREDGEDIFYNGFKGSDIRTPYGFTKLGIENVGVFFTRGILLDIARFKSVEFLDGEYIITIDDIQGTLVAQQVEIREGDAVFFRTGHGRLWMVDNDRYSVGEPGPGVTAVKWLIEKKVVLLGADNWGMEAVPGENPDRPFEAHQWLMQKNGIYNLENLDLDELAKDLAYEFAFIFAPVPFKGATGSPGNPIGVR